MGILRTILAIAVVCAHCKWNGSFVFTGGQAAVQCFYIISGFLISFVLTHNIAYANAGRFFINRVLRFYPVYWVVALISLVAALYGDA